MADTSGGRTLTGILAAREAAKRRYRAVTASAANYIRARGTLLSGYCHRRVRNVDRRAALLALVHRRGSPQHTLSPEVA